MHPANMDGNLRVVDQNRTTLLDSFDYNEQIIFNKFEFTYTPVRESVFVEIIEYGKTVIGMRFDVNQYREWLKACLELIGEEK